MEWTIEDSPTGAGYLKYVAYDGFFKLVVYDWLDTVDWYVLGSDKKVVAGEMDQEISVRQAKERAERAVQALGNEGAPPV